MGKEYKMLELKQIKSDCRFLVVMRAYTLKGKIETKVQSIGRFSRTNL